MTLKRAIALGVGIGAILGITIGLWRQSVQQPASSAPLRLQADITWPPGKSPSPDFRLIDQSGKAIRLSSLRGHVVLLTFMDSHCRKDCPIEGKMLHQTAEALGGFVRPILAVVSVNPADTPASAQRFIKEAGLLGDWQWHWFMGSSAELTRVWSAYHIFVRPTKGDITHNSVIYLIDQRGDSRAGFSFPFSPGILARDIRMLDGQR